MKFINKFFLNMGLFSVLAILLMIPIVAVTMTGFNIKNGESSEVLSAQDTVLEENTLPKEEIPAELEEIIRRVEMEMAKAAAESAGLSNLEIGD